MGEGSRPGREDRTGGAGAPSGVFPAVRPRRLRRSPALRRLVRETSLSVDDLVQPLFVVPGKGVRKPIDSLPGQFHLSADETAAGAEALADLGIPGVLLFGVPEGTDDEGRGAYDENGLVQTAVRGIRERLGDRLAVMTDVCLCAYLPHGHCGVVGEGPHGRHIENDRTLPILARAAASHAAAGADVVAPSDMMDGRVAAIRAALDTDGFSDVAILSYTAKYTSAFYGPFREAAGSPPAFGDRGSYQMDPGNILEAEREAAQDLAEGADMLMIKPALAYLDVVARIKSRFGVPTAAYNVSGEYAAVCAAAERGWVDRKRGALETLLSIKRAGADLIPTYWAKEAAGWLRETA